MGFASRRLGTFGAVLSHSRAREHERLQDLPPFVDKSVFAVLLANCRPRIVGLSVGTTTSLTP